MDMYWPAEKDTIRSDYDLITYEGNPRFTGKVFFPAVYKEKFGNLSSLPFVATDEEDSIYSVEEFPIGTLAVFRIEQKLQNYQIHNIHKVLDHEVIYYYRYEMVPYTLTNTRVNSNDVNLNDLERDRELVTDLVNTVDPADEKLNTKPAITRRDDQYGQKMFVRRIKVNK